MPQSVPVGPIDTVDLFPEVHAELLALLRSLAPGDWEKPTAAAPWTVRDVTAHLLDTDIRRLTFQRDKLPGLRPQTPIASYEDLVAFVNGINASWVEVARRIGPALLIDFHTLVGPQVHRFFKSLDPHAPSRGAVSWASDEIAPNWFDLAREYTEKWHHQQHIREAVGAPGLTDRRWLHPALDTFVRGLPRAYRNIVSPDGTQVALDISGEAGDSWTLLREESKWQLYHGEGTEATARVRMDQDTAWHLFTKGLDQAAARAQTSISGDEALGAQLLQMISIIA